MREKRQQRHLTTKGTEPARIPAGKDTEGMTISFHFPLTYWKVTNNVPLGNKDISPQRTQRAQRIWDFIFF